MDFHDSSSEELSKVNAMYDMDAQLKVLVSQYADVEQPDYSIRRYEVTLIDGSKLPVGKVRYNNIVKALS